MKIPNFDTAPKEKAYSGYGKAMLSKMGWSEGDGLGKNCLLYTSPSPRDA